MTVAIYTFRPNIVKVPVQYIAILHLLTLQLLSSPLWDYDIIQLYPLLSTGSTQEGCPNMTEKKLTGMIRSNTNKMISPIVVWETETSVERDTLLYWRNLCYW